ncbi:potassium channel family protein [Candidatus Micrarchaeota archaeon]|nr:potassium channel family protein [Candidatus Micrarchaeota archaeon]
MEAAIRKPKSHHTNSRDRDLGLFVGLSSVGGLLLLGTLFYHIYEGWNYVDSFYFAAMTLTTVGYGDLIPSTDISKMFTVFFAFAGIGVVLYVITIFAGKYLESRMR